MFLIPRHFCRLSGVNKARLTRPAPSVKRSGESFQGEKTMEQNRAITCIASFPSFVSAGLKPASGIRRETSCPTFTFDFTVPAWLCSCRQLERRHDVSFNHAGSRNIF